MATWLMVQWTRWCSFTFQFFFFIVSLQPLALAVAKSDGEANRLHAENYDLWCHRHSMCLSLKEGMAVQSVPLSPTVFFSLPSSVFLPLISRCGSHCHFYLLFLLLSKSAPSGDERVPSLTHFSVGKERERVYDVCDWMWITSISGGRHVSNNSSLFHVR